MKKKIVTTLLVTTLCLSLSACGVSQEEYDSLVKERDSLQNELDTVILQSEKANDDLKNISDILSYVGNDVSVSESNTIEGNVLFVNAGSGENTADITQSLMDMIGEDWFIYDYIMINQYVDGYLSASILYRVSDAQLGSCIWIDNDYNLQRYNTQFQDIEQEQESEANESNLPESNADKSKYTFSPGEYLVGKDIPAGIYDVLQIDGVGHLRIIDNDGNSKMNINDSYKNLKLEDGYSFVINTTAVYELNTAG